MVLIGGGPCHALVPVKTIAILIIIFYYCNHNNSVVSIINNA